MVFVPEKYTPLKEQKEYSGRTIDDAKKGDSDMDERL